MSDGNTHNNYSVPVVVGGRARLSHQGKPPPEVSRRARRWRISSLSLMDRFGVQRGEVRRQHGGDRSADRVAVRCFDAKAHGVSGRPKGRHYEEQTTSSRSAMRHEARDSFVVLTFRSASALADLKVGTTTGQEGGTTRNRRRRRVSAMRHEARDSLRSADAFMADLKVSTRRSEVGTTTGQEGRAVDDTINPSAPS